MKKYVIGGIVVLALALTGYQAAHQKAKPVTVAVPTKSLVALGDSVAAGVGLADDSDSSACDRTNQSYPYVAAKALNYNLHNVACSQATLTEGILGSQTVNELKLDSQLNQLFALKMPEVITLTIGANDANWISVIGKCYTATCGSDADTAAVAARLATLTTNLKTALTKIHDHYGATVPKVIVTGYHQVFPVALVTGCSDLTGIDAAELAWGRQQQAALTAAVKDAVVSDSKASFASIDFSGHELCSKDPWVQGIGAKQVYHPTTAGQARIAAIIEQEVKK